MEKSPAFNGLRPTATRGTHRLGRAAYAQRFSRKHGPESVRRWRRLRNLLALQDLAHRFGYKSRQHAQYIDRHLCASPRQRQKSKQSYTPKLSKEVFSRLVRKYRGREKIAEKGSVSVYAVDRLRKYYHISLPDFWESRRKRIRTRCAKIVALREQGYTISQIAKRLEVSRPAVYRYNKVYRLGLSLQPCHYRPQQRRKRAA